MKRTRREFLVGAAILGAAALFGFGGDARAAPRGGSGPKVITPPTVRTARSSAVRASAAAGGHLHKHVGASPAYLASRTQSMDMRFSFEAAARRGRKGRKAAEALSQFRARPSRISSFRNGPTMDRIYEQAMRRERAQVAAWARTAKPGDSYRLGFSSAKPVGTVYTTMPGSGTGRHAPASRGEFILRKGGSAGVYPHTAKLFVGREAPTRRAGAATDRKAAR
ncbi:RNase A-like domain-containing protein [Antarcticirhabdus aurantiaca]|uniref:Uncharacterized protein n=1 Tax=Antarcticirhabdus aurantiaca TaxID=2606717 RepID=A0ACD4NR94_9HYPH|nr:RNase A-like domain-containing protein [Antarcticirhabdus aurantiaca]WAJ29451.1 hypothetical protein OXU80_04220 [Jeongeuplla avenae]